MVYLSKLSNRRKKSGREMEYSATRARKGWVEGVAGTGSTGFISVLLAALTGS